MGGTPPQAPQIVTPPPPQIIDRPAPDAGQTASDIAKSRLEFDPLLARQQVSLQEELNPRLTKLNVGLQEEFAPRLAQSQFDITSQFAPQQRELFESIFPTQTAGLEALGQQALQQIGSPGGLTQSQQQLQDQTLAQSRLQFSPQGFGQQQPQQQGFGGQQGQQAQALQSLRGFLGNRPQPGSPEFELQSQLGTDAATLNRDTLNFFTGDNQLEFGTPEYDAALAELQQRRQDIEGRGFNFGDQAVAAQQQGGQLSQQNQRFIPPSQGLQRPSPQQAQQGLPNFGPQTRVPTAGLGLLEQRALEQFQSPVGLTAQQQSAQDAVRQRQRDALNRNVRESANIGGTLFGGRRELREDRAQGELAQSFATQDIQLQQQQRQQALQQLLASQQSQLQAAQVGQQFGLQDVGLQQQARDRALQNLIASSQVAFPQIQQPGVPTPQAQTGGFGVVPSGDALLQALTLTNINPVVQGPLVLGATPGQQGAGSLFAQGFGQGLGGSICHVAEVLYGVHDLRTVFARIYVLNNETPFTKLYRRFSRQWAMWLEKHPWAQRFVQPIWDKMWRRGLHQTLMSWRGR